MSFAPPRVAVEASCPHLRPLHRRCGAAAAAPAESSALELTLRALRPILADPEVTELCINRPGEAFIETRSAGSGERCRSPTSTGVVRLAKLVANSTRQRIDEESPLLSASLPSGERIQIVLPPATTPGRSRSRSAGRPMRCGASRSSRGAGSSARRAARRDALDETEQELLRLLEAQEYEAFMRLAVRAARTSWSRARPARARPPGPRR